MTGRLVFMFDGQVIVYQDEPTGRVARIFGTHQVMPMSPALQAAIDAEIERLAKKARE